MTRISAIVLAIGLAAAPLKGEGGRILKPEGGVLESERGALEGEGGALAGEDGRAAKSEARRALEQAIGGSFSDRSFSYRNLGPFRAGSWVSDIAVPDAPAKAHLYSFYVAARNGGVWKTTNNGTTFAPVFEGKNVGSIGAVAVALSSSEIVWAGTGDASCARSAYWGDGVYKSTDSGASWQNTGLADSQHISRIVIDPANPDTVYVAAMGHLFSTNEERGVFKTTNGGRTWSKVLYVDNKTGVIDMVMDRSHPDTLYAATYQCIRQPWRIADGGPASGIFKTTDGGANWKKLAGGLPDGEIGR